MHFFFFYFFIKARRMSGIALNELNKTISEISAKAMLIINVIDKVIVDRHSLFRTMTNKVKEENSKQ